VIAFKSISTSNKPLIFLLIYTYLSKRTIMQTTFIESLRQNGITIDQIINHTVIYAGGDHDKHLKYFVRQFKRNNTNIRTVPFNSKRCLLCKHRIKLNCYLYDTGSNKFFVLCKCCVKKFLELEETLINNTTSSSSFPMKADKPKKHTGLRCIHTYFKPVPLLYQLKIEYI
jgi:hypothetical protein